jgi:hypothetical protein
MWKLRYAPDPLLPDSRLQTLKSLLLKAAAEDPEDPEDRKKAKEEEEIRWLAT